MPLFKQWRFGSLHGIVSSQISCDEVGPHIHGEALPALALYDTHAQQCSLEVGHLRKEFWCCGAPPRPERELPVISAFPIPKETSTATRRCSYVHQDLRLVPQHVLIISSMKASFFIRGMLSKDPVACRENGNARLAGMIISGFDAAPRH